MTYDDWTTYAEEMGIPESEIETVLEAAEICQCNDDNGPCYDSTRAAINRAAERFENEPLSQCCGERITSLNLCAGCAEHAGPVVTDKTQRSINRFLAKAGATLLAAGVGFGLVLLAILRPSDLPW